MRYFKKLSLALTFGVLLGASTMSATPASASGELSVTPTTWDIIGLKSNNSGITDGPERFPVGVRVCNTTGATLSGAQTKLVWDSSNSYVALSGSDTNQLGDLLPGKCADSYYIVQVQKTSAAWNTTREYHIEASADGGATGSSPQPRQLYVEKMNAQNRNDVYAISGAGGCNADYSVCDPAPTELEAGKEYIYKLYAETASSYEQLEAFLSFPGSLFRVKGISSEYQIPSGATVDGPYADACGWDPVPTSATYRSCIGPIPAQFQPDGKVGGKVVVTYKVVATGVGTGSLRALIYDYSGNSYHYNQDYPDIPVDVTVKYPLDVEIIGQGNVKTDVGGIDCGLGGTKCKQIYKKDTLVTLAAQPGEGQEFLGWSGGGCSGTEPTCTVTMDQARKVTATFSDKKKGEIVVNKSLSPTDDPGLFDLKIDGETKAEAVGNGGTTGSQKVWAGQHTISEIANTASPNPLSDYSSSLECKDGDQTVPSVDGKIDLAADQKIVCAFTNIRKTGKITINKSMTPQDDPGRVDLLLNDQAKATSVGDGGTTGQIVVPTGKQLVGERTAEGSPNPLSDYNSSLECKDSQGVIESTNGKVQVDEGQEVVCVWSNIRKTGKLTVKKSLSPAADPGLFDLRINGDIKASAVGDGGTTGAQTVATGKQTISEDTASSSPVPLASYNTSVACKDNQGEVPVTQAGELTVSEDQNVVCVWSNTRRAGTLQLKKSLQPQDDPGKFDLKIDGQSKASNVGDGGATSQQYAPEGEYTIAEAAGSESPTTLDDYSTQLDCKAGEATVEVSDNKVKVGDGQNVICTFTNTRKVGTITVKKSLSPASDPGLFDLKINDQTKASGVGDGGTTGEQTLPVGTYSIAEASNAGSPTTLSDYNSALECKDGEQTVPVENGKVELENDQKIVCIFTNTRKAGTLTVKKSLSPASDPGLFDLQIDGTTKASGVGDGGTTGAQYAVAGEHTVGEIANASSPTALTDYDTEVKCQTPNSRSITPVVEGKVEVGDGQDIVCVITNIRKPGGLEIRKSLSPASDPGLFDLKVNDVVKASGVGDGGSTGIQEVAPGEYFLAEAANSGSPTTLADYNSKLTCEDQEGPVDVQDGKVEVESNQKIVCVFTNTRKSGTLTLKKSLSPASDPGLFDLKIDDVVKASGVGDGGSTGEQYVVMGEHVVSESAGASSPTTLADYNAALECKDGEQTVASAGGKVDVGDGQNIVCTFTNTRKAGTLTVQKSLSPTSDPGLFDLKINGVTKASGVGDGGTTGEQNVTAGEYVVSEDTNSASPNPIQLYKDSLECKDGDETIPSVDGKVEVGDGQKIVCTFTNVRKTGQVTVKKNLSPASDPGLFDLKIDDVIKASNVGDGGSTGLQTLPTGDHTISEAAGSSSPTSLANYNSSLECRDEKGVLPSEGGKIYVDENQQIVCIFTNTRKAGTLTVKKSLSPASDPGLFDLKIDDVVKASGVGDGGSTGQQYALVGEHTVSEAAGASSPTTLADYNSSLECKDGEQTVSSTDGKVQVGDGQDIVCIFTNVRKTGSIVLQKSLSPASDPGLFDLKIDDVTKASGVGDGGSTGTQEVLPGTHALSEAANSSSPTTLADYNSALECKDGEKTVPVQDGKVDVLADQKIVCTFTNTRKSGTLQVKKALSPTSDPGLFDLKIDGVTKASAVGDGGSTGEQYALAGEHTVSEDTNASSPTTLADYNAALACQDEKGPVDSTGGKVQVADGQKIVCTFTNTRKQAIQYPLTAAVVGNGTVTSNVGGIDCPGVLCNKDYDDGTVVTLVPKASAGWVFQGWTGDCTNKTGNCVVTMSQARNVTAVFAAVAPAARFTLRTQILPRGKGRVRATGGLNCISTCRKTYKAGTLVKLTERPKRGYYFVRWSGACRKYGRKNYCKVRMNRSQSVYALYRKIPTRPRFTG